MTPRSHDRDPALGPTATVSGRHSSARFRCPRCPVVSLAPGCACGVKNRAWRSAPSPTNSKSSRRCSRRSSAMTCRSGPQVFTAAHSFVRTLACDWPQPRRRPPRIPRPVSRSRRRDRRGLCQRGGLMSDNPSSTGGPPTRLRNIVGSAIGSLSRLGAGSMPQPPIVPRATPLGAPDAAADDIPRWGGPLRVSSGRRTCRGKSSRIARPWRCRRCRRTLSLVWRPRPRIRGDGRCQ